MAARTAVATVLIAVPFVAASCGPQPARPGAQPAAAGGTSQPELLEAPRDWEPRFADFPLEALEPVWMREEHVPRIEYDPRYSDYVPDDLRGVLAARQGEIESLIEVSNDLPGTIPIFAFGDPARTQENEHLGEPRGRVMNGLRVLRADAVRLHETGDDAEAFRRLGAAARISLALARQADEFHTLLGMGTGGATIHETAAIARDGLRGTPHPDDARAILAMCEHLRNHVPVESPILDRAIADIEAALGSRTP